ncbi:3-hydroxyisobutyrate dehydrogenase-like beta-hydroxyacid dehydrogenase [Saccharopolyspora erythraea NRRL 2338]|uniref:6-phosphogluconate dehydrogenase, NAD-binding n=2 Tax=Saccharopolyspora erythraea TaxID=1836 RepID=A4FKK3_SACEN|nr:NAD(P)-binding domain-containing protein [Saccharopolyspora erythraea]EQD82915.1 6-phosphogluconate dehydrogenase [Saccharopolyspora erythraea D]PFG98216.1 3-hydroxyisobutyrate dehydrogenase-like beta-hydroxyacid dehydrogenase [Saccharopolyspora erythraea NRRL 2338]QRK88314.1 NAD(P)-dependent oxidoreductase [Saccharopolyspora erythraea]CAM04578.1 6-phosphogluconate dehydrogenase, NAD-binding [Saccharopolyspora erythraea NRRL 2338]
MNEHKEAVTVIGLGPMGRSIVRVLLAAGHPVTVWNRTPGRADALVAEGAVRAQTPAEAVAASGLVLLSLTDYQAMYDILGDGESLSGKVVVNLSSDTPERGREAAKWAAERGARFLTGGIMVPENLVGDESAYTYYSGPREVLDAHEPVLRLIGRPDYVGTDPGLAQLYYLAQMDIFLGSLSLYLHATALLGSAGVPPKEFLPWAVQNFDGVSYFLAGAAEAVDEGVHPGEAASALMMGASADHLVGASEAAGIDLVLPKAIQSHYARAVAAGHGKDSWTSLINVIRDPSL